METTNAIIYVRVSDPNQVTGTSLEFQEEECRKYCERQGMVVAAVFREEGESAKDLSLNNRREFLRGLEHCRKNKGKVGHFVVLRVDRFARSTEDHFAVRKLLLDCGVTLHSVTETIGNNPSEKFIETVLAGAAEYDNAIRKQRCIDGMMSKIRQGIWPWHPPPGYVCAHTKKRGEKKTTPDMPDDRTFPMIQRALREYAKGVFTLSDIARKLDEWGLAEIRGTKTQKQLADRLLGHHLKFFAGILVNPWTGEEHQGLHEPMITQEEYEQIRLVRSGKAFRVKRDRSNPEFPLRRIALCSGCCRSLTGSVSRGNGGQYAYYHCGWRQCRLYGKGIQKARLEEDFTEYLATITPAKKFWTLFGATVLKYRDDMSLQAELSTKGRKVQVAALEERRRRVFEMREDGSYGREEFQERRDAIDAELAAAKRAAATSPTDDFDPTASLQYASGLLTALGRQWREFLPQLRSRFQRLVLPYGIPYDRDAGFGTAQLGLIYELNRQYLAADSQDVPLMGLSWNLLMEELRELQELRGESTLSLLV